MFDIQENLKLLPDKPGVYIHKDKLGQIIYVGKAVSLKNRVRQYFQSSRNMEPKVRAMVSHIEEFEYITTNTEMEALILENNLIKKYLPQYNVLLRDDKTYPYIKITTNEAYPRILKTRRILHDGCKYFGPYTDVGAVNQIISLFNEIFALKRCSAQNFTEGFRPCLNFHINQCRGICTGRVDSAEYQQVINQIVELLNGKRKPMIDFLTKEMTREAEALNYEKAAEYRDYINSIHAITEKQRVVLLAAGDMDVIIGAKGKGNAHVVLFFVRQGKLSGRESYHLQAMEEDSMPEVISAFVKQYYSENMIIPKEILLESSLDDIPLMEGWLTELKGSQVKMSVPQKGDKKALLDLAKRDVVEMMKTLDEKASAQKEKNDAIARELEVLIPTLGNGVEETGKAKSRRGWRVESYDISNTNGVDSVGAMVVFEGSHPIRKDYRRFKIKTIEGPNDYGSMQEMITRRFKRALEGDKSFITFPDFILMDGGKPQVGAAEQVLNRLGLEIPVVGMVKDDKHRTRGLLYQNQELDLKNNPVLYRYAAMVQEEVHRFAIEYHQSLRNKSMQRSVLDEIEGIGEKRRNALLHHFGSIDNIRSASLTELEGVPGMSKMAAEQVRKWVLKK